MTTIDQLFSKEKLESHIAAGLVRATRHPSLPLTIYCYGKRVQYENAWDEVTTACRGLIVDDSGVVVARPFPKIGSIEAYSRSDIIFSKPFVATEKLDGSLIIQFGYKNLNHFSTKGSFVSPQVELAREIWNQEQHVMWAPENSTFLYELIHPDNSIVVDYGDKAELVLLAVIDNETGLDVPLDKIEWSGATVKTFETYAHPRDVLKNLGLDTAGGRAVEGVVLRFDYPKGSYTRMKVKTEDYKRLHALMTGTSAKTVWTYLSSGTSLNLLLEDVPDEFAQFVMDTGTKLQDGFVEIEEICLRDLAASPVPKSEWKSHRNQLAEYVKTCKYPGVLFAMADGIDYSEHIWKLLRPRYEAQASVTV